jgi:hypothetical protein
MRKNASVDRQQKQIEVRVNGLRREVEGNPFGGLFTGSAQVELAYLLGAKHALRWAKNESVYPPSEFQVESKK